MSVELAQRADYFQHHALALRSRRRYERGVAYFAAVCAEGGVAPIITIELLEACLGKRADEVGPDALQGLLSGIRWWARRYGGLALTYADSVVAIITGSRRAHPRARHEPYDRAKLLRISQALGQAPLDKRDRALCVFTFAAMPTQAALAALRRADLQFESDQRGVTAVLGRPRAREVYLGCARDPALCPVRTLLEWLRVPGPDPQGYVFVGRGPRGDYNRTPVNHFLVNSALHRAAYVAGLGPRPISTQTFRASAIHIASKSLGVVPLAYALGFASPHALRRYGVPIPVVDANVVRAQRHRPQPRRLRK